MRPTSLVFAIGLVCGLNLQASACAQQASGSSDVAVAVGSQYDTTHVYVAPTAVDGFVNSFLGLFGGKSTKQVTVTLTPTPSTTSSQLLQTPVGTVSLFGFTTPIPFPFGAERTGYYVTDMDQALHAARASGAEIVVAKFSDPIGLDAVFRWPGGVMTQLYWHTTKSSYDAFRTIPENRVYVSPDAADQFVGSFLAFSKGRIVHDEASEPGVEIGQAGKTFREVQIESTFGKMVVFVTNGQLPFPYGRETTGYEVTDVSETLTKASALGVKVLVPAYHSAGRASSMIEFPGGYIAEIHSRDSAQ